MMTLGLEMTTLFAFFENAFRPTTCVSMRNDEKFCSIRTGPTSKNTTTESYSINSSTLGVIGLAGMSLPGGKWGHKGAKYRKMEHLDNYFRFD